ncbi:hypothetical protein [Streptomyces sp. NPDC057702]|uniref:hypothetical protein n=1 Tax=unclassified Streptomyces TaxID=2593676 RepID=UPI0036B55881
MTAGPARGPRRYLAPHLLLGIALTGVVFAALGHGALFGPRWLLLVGLVAGSLTLAAFGALAERDTTRDAAWPLRSEGPRAYAPALVHGVRAVSRVDGRPAADPHAQSSVFEFDLTVVPPEGRPPYRVRVRNPVDVQDLLHRDRAVVQYDPGQPWRVIIPSNPPAEWRARAARLDPAHLASARQLHPAGLPPAAPILALGLTAAAAFLALVRLAG